MRRFSSSVWSLGFVAVVSFAAAAHAEPKDQAVLDLAKDAVFHDYLSTKFNDAQKKLEKAIAMCGGAGQCSNKVVGQVHRDLGVVLVAGLGKRDEGKAEFKRALQADARVALDADLSSDELDAVFQEAKKELAGGAEPPPEKPPEPVEKPPEGPPPATGEVVHTPPGEQAVRTPVPFYVELPEGASAARIELRYRTFGSKEWKVIEMTRHKSGYAAEVPCLDVGTTGKLEYFIQATDAAGAFLAASGTPTKPHVVQIKNELIGDAPHLPGKPPPAQCADPGDCPPDFPGCKHVEGDEGAGATVCTQDSDCGSGESCVDGSCEEAATGGAEAKKNWLGLGVQQDVLLFSAGTEVCSGGNEYSCFYEDPDEYYEDIPYEGGGNEVASGLKPATTRLYVSYDRLLGKNVTAGVRLGYAFGGGPKVPDRNAFLPLHAEARFAYWFGSDPFAKKGLRPFVALAGGLAEVQGKVLVTVYENQAAYDADERTKLAAWKRAGTGFAALGAGTFFAFTPRSMLGIELRYMQMFGNSASVFAGGIGFAQGL